jgi:hypothetical protein
MRMVTIRFDVRKLLAVVLGGIALWLIAGLRSGPPPARARVHELPPAQLGRDPEPLRMERLEHLQFASAGRRNLFQFVVTKGVETRRGNDIVEPPHPSPDRAEPQPLIFYGFIVRHQTHPRAFFFDGSDTYSAAEGDPIAGRFRVLRIGANSVELEDISRKNILTLPLAD